MKMRSLVMKKSWEIRRNVAKEVGCKPSEVSASIALKMAWEFVKNSNNQETGLTVIENQNNSKSYFKDFKFNHKIEDNNLFELLKMIKNFQSDLVNFMNDFKIRKVFENYFKEIFSDSLTDLINIIGEILHDEKILNEIFYNIVIISVPTDNRFHERSIKKSRNLACKEYFRDYLPNELKKIVGTLNVLNSGFYNNDPFTDVPELIGSEILSPMNQILITLDSVIIDAYDELEEFEKIDKFSRSFF